MAILIILSGLILRFGHLNLRSFWCDEFLAISLSRLSLSEMLGWVIKNDAHPPLFYAIVHFLFNFTQSELGLRIIPALFGTGAIVIFYLVLMQMRPDNYLLPVLLFALSPAAVLWSQTVKSYSMLTFFSLLSALMFFNLQKTRKIIYAAGWFLSTLIALYLHNYGAIILFAQVVVIFTRRKESPPKFFYPTLALILLAYLPYLTGPVFSQIAFVRGATHTVTSPFLRMVYTFYYFVFGETLSPLNLKFVLPGTALFIIFFLSGLFAKKDVLQIFSSVVFITAVALIFLVRATIPQNLIHLQPFFFVIVSSGIAYITKRKIRIVVSCLLVMSLIPSLYYYYRGDSLQYQDAGRLIPYRQICRLIQEEEHPGEIVIMTEQRERRFSEFFVPYSPWDWYYKGNLALIEVHPESAEKLSRELAEIYEKYDGFWLLLSYGFAEHSFNEQLKDFFLAEKSVKIKEMKLIENFSFLDVIRGKGKREYYFLEVYHIVKTQSVE